MHQIGMPRPAADRAPSHLPPQELFSSLAWQMAKPHAQGNTTCTGEHICACMMDGIFLCSGLLAVASRLEQRKPL